jgi:hypothetical protein
LCCLSWTRFQFRWVESCDWLEIRSKIVTCMYLFAWVRKQITCFMYTQGTKWRRILFIFCFEILWDTLRPNFSWVPILKRSVVSLFGCEKNGTVKQCSSNASVALKIAVVLTRRRTKSIINVDDHRVIHRSHSTRKTLNKI